MFPVIVADVSEEPHFTYTPDQMNFYWGKMC